MLKGFHPAIQRLSVTMLFFCYVWTLSAVTYRWRLNDQCDVEKEQIQIAHKQFETNTLNSYKILMILDRNKNFIKLIEVE